MTFSGISTIAAHGARPYFYAFNPFTMQKRLLSMLAFLSLFLVTMSGCDKGDDPPPPTTKTKTELITQSSWKFEKITASGVDFTDNPTFACLKDNSVSFSTNLSGNITEGTTICSPTTAGAFTWEFRTNETILYISTSLITTGNNEFKIESITETNMVLSQTVTVPGIPIPVNAVVTLKH